MNFDFAQIIRFSKDRFYRILKNVFLSQIFEKIVKFDTETLEKAEIMKIDGKKISALPPETRKWLKTNFSDNHGQNILRQMQFLHKKRLS